jgi:hypothetical protein
MSGVADAARLAAGTLQPGKYADIVAIEGSPIASIDDTERRRKPVSNNPSLTGSPDSD